MELILVWIVFSIGVAIAANSRGRNAFGWFLLGCVISPLLAAILLVIMPSNREAGEPSWMAQREGKSRKCPYCAEFIKPEAIVCKHCGRDLPSSKAPNAFVPRDAEPRAAEFSDLMYRAGKAFHSRPAIYTTIIVISVTAGLSALGHFVATP